MLAALDTADQRIARQVRGWFEIKLANPVELLQRRRRRSGIGVRAETLMVHTVAVARVRKTQSIAGAFGRPVESRHGGQVAIGALRHPGREARHLASCRHGVRALSPDRPIKLLTQLARCPRATARSWVTGHRRPPIYVLKLLRVVIRGEGTGLELELEYEIRKRENEPRHLTGFCQIDPATGRDKRNRLGRPKRIKAADPAVNYAGRSR